MPISIEDVVELWRERKKALAPVHARMEEMRAAVNGDMDLPLAELDRTERPMTANLIRQGLEATAQRVTSTLPDVSFPAMRDGFKNSEERARNRRLAVLAWWEMNRMDTLLAERSYKFLSYGVTPVVVDIDTRRGIPRWHQKNPLTSYWAPGADLCPDDGIFTFVKPFKWLRRKYPEATLRLSQGSKVKPDDTFTILEYYDEYESTLIAMGRTDEGSVEGWQAGRAWEVSNGAPYVLLKRDPCLTGMCPVVMPMRISLDRLGGQFDEAVPLYWNQSMLMALELIAVKRGIFKDEWIESRQNETAMIVAEADGIRGERGIITGGTIRQMSSEPGVQTYPTIDRIERSLRLAGGIPAEFSGESPSNIRTARRGAQVLSSAVDYNLQQTQMLLANSLEEENCRAIALAKALLPGRRSFWVNWNGKSAWTEYDPKETFETDRHSVRYAIPGANINELIVGGGQRLGMGTLSKETWMRLDPLIDDPELELRRVDMEGLRAAQMSSLQTGAANGTIPPADLARIIQLRREVEIEEAVIKVQEEAQERQASAGPVGAPDGPVEPGAPEAQPGLAVPGAGAEAPEAIEKAGPSTQNLSSLLTSLRRPQQQMTRAG